ncbi:MAG: DUF1330 domain-containing protein [Actinomycetota bacterium]|nr:DUF1330 domain-containing protein [Actinomycetota bacterium]
MFLEPTPETGQLFAQRGLDGPVTMLNLLRFRDQADYRTYPELAPPTPITGREAYDRYAEHTRPFLEEAGGRVAFLGKGGFYLIGPTGERWDMVMMVEYGNVAAFMGMAENQAYRAGLGHRSAALEDSRLLPIEPVGA